ncbi:MAG: beta-ketoacyl-[acyl-carrier-protein] synthase family protein [Proteobacteria bacterium]|nr:beta-ketoacyl-[acyl-carrier-protein] synthase family protein [Pseudomonadota bacterium]MBU1710653.1 beta-ketoacyl-[acyl-carrier-protein] synthase family protein [Pseudomonadota bacterium]
MSVNRVVITGRGAVSPFGIGTKQLTEGVWENRSAVRLIDEWRKIRGMYSFLAAPVPVFDPKDYLPRGLRRTMGDMAIYATLAAQEAVGDAAISENFLQSGAVGAAIGSTTGSPQAYEDFYRKFLPDETIEEIKSGVFFKIMGHSCAANVCLALGIAGEQWSPVSACTSASQALGLGYMLVKSGRQKAVLCGGADEVHHSVTMVFDVVKAASRQLDTPQTTPRPFDVLRDGVVCGGGSGILVLESLESAQSRGARIYCEVLGFGHVNDCNHIANPHADSMAHAIRNAIGEAEVSTDDIDYVNAHATGTIQGDIAESQAIHQVFGSKIPVSSFKGHIGHTLGAAGALETIIALEMFKRQELIPTLNLENPDPECAPVSFVKKIEKSSLNTILKNNFALGGVNTSLVLRRWAS